MKGQQKWMTFKIRLCTGEYNNLRASVTQRTIQDDISQAEDSIVNGRSMGRGLIDRPPGPLG